MKTRNPTTLALAPLVHYGDRPELGAPRFLVLLPKDGGRLVVTLHGKGLVAVRSVEYRDAEDFAAIGVPAPSGDRFEPFEVFGVPYRLDWSKNEADGSRLPYLFANRLDGFHVGSDATPGAVRKLRELCGEVAAWVLGFQVEAANEANRREALREVESIDGKLAKLAEEVATLQARRHELGGEELPSLAFEQGRAVLRLDGFETTLAARDGCVRLGLDFVEDVRDSRPLAFRFGEAEGNEASGMLAQEVLAGLRR
jgi:hypothetical protein